jgi:hypothetical protein
MALQYYALLVDFASIDAHLAGAWIGDCRLFRQFQDLGATEPRYENVLPRHKGSMAQSIPASEFNRLSVPHLDACRRIGPCHRRSIIDVAYGSILLKNSENERRQKIRLWSCRADRATRCHRQFATIAAHGKVSLSAEPLALSSRSPPAASRIVIAAKNRVFQQYRSFSTFRPRARPVRCTSRTGRTGQNQILRSRAITGLTSRSSSSVDGQSASSATKWTFSGRSNQTFCLQTSGCVEDAF